MHVEQSDYLRIYIIIQVIHNDMKCRMRKNMIINDDG